MRRGALAGVVGTGLVAGAVLLAVLLAGARRRSASPPHSRTFYVDCSAAGRGEGTAARPWHTLAPAGGLRLGAGSRLLLRRGSECTGTLLIRGSGRPGRPIVVGAYGQGARPRIEAEGRAPDAVTMAGASYALIEDLELTNRGDGRRVLRGLHIAPVGALRPHDIVVRRLDVHDVVGAEAKNTGGSGGIQVDLPSRNVLIEDNRVDRVARSGIWVAGTGSALPRPPATRPWPAASTGIVVRGNEVSSVAGDAIVPTGTEGTVISGNVVCCGNLAGRRNRQYDAGIWTFHANGTVIEDNVVRDMAHGEADGTGYDVDYDQDGTIVQYNVGVHNGGGFTLLCTDSGIRNAAVRFNLSLDEPAFNVDVCGTDPRTLGTLTGVAFYNNTLVLSTSRVPYEHVAMISRLPFPGLRFFNNVLIADPPRSLPLPCGAMCTDNLSWGLPASGRRAVSADPRLRSHQASSGAGTPTTLAAALRPRPGSPVAGRGEPIPPSAARDFFGRRIRGAPPLGFALPR